MLDKIGSVLGVIECSDPTGQEISYRIPEEGWGEIVLGSQSVVRDDQVAIFFRQFKAARALGDAAVARGSGEGGPLPGVAGGAAAAALDALLTQQTSATPTTEDVKAACEALTNRFPWLEQPVKSLLGTPAALQVLGQITAGSL